MSDTEREGTMPKLTKARQAQVARFEKALARWEKARENRDDTEELELSVKGVYDALEEKPVEPAVGPLGPAPKAIITPPPEL